MQYETVRSPLNLRKCSILTDALITTATPRLLLVILAMSIPLQAPWRVNRPHRTRLPLVSHTNLLNFACGSSKCIAFQGVYLEARIHVSPFFVHGWFVVIDTRLTRTSPSAQGGSISGLYRGHADNTQFTVEFNGNAGSTGFCANFPNCAATGGTSQQ